MTTTLSNGVKVPDVGSINWASDLETNWQLLNACIGAVGSNVQTDRANTWTARQTFTLPIYGDVVGTATMASSDASGNDIPTTYATKTELAAKAADSEVVHRAGAETITGDKTWTGINAFTSPVHAVTSQSVPITENPSAEIVGNNFRFIDNDRFWGQFVPVWGTDGSFRIDLGISNWTTTGNQGYWSLSTEISKDFGTLSFYTSHANANLGTPSNSWNTVWTQAVRAPGTSNALILAAMETWEDGARIFMYGKDNVNGSTLYADVDHDDGNHGKTGVALNKYGFYPAGISRHLGLADANNKWLTFNGISPGNLSIPNISSVVDISGSITSFDGTTIDLSSIITVPGWINIAIPYVGGDYICFMLGRAGGSTAFNNSRYIICGSSDGNFISVFAPVSMGLSAQTKIKASGGAVTLARFYPCLGNV